ncbi:thiamine-phosphate kinase [Leeia aquatica]|uniref:Thiamine-monophosphate kinase n=1 Tax=Leeia aquatica TaxID=2725557 RepID=A0A847S901_9NEIS|nr:thiamine-phosphate kinase [Leeia aquatica]NLR73839.1 thiamine-phosphate kinase [Leeia aquatica]
MSGEFDLIRRYFTWPAHNAVLGVGDDAALLQPSPGQQLVVSADMLVAGRHFFADTDPVRLGHKALAVNLSDMAAMGATPRWAMLSLALPEVDEGWLGGFSQGFRALAEQHAVSLIGGDTTCGPLNLSIQIMGEVPPGQALRRDGAQAGDDLWVSGTLGDAAFALQSLLGKVRLTPVEASMLCLRLEQPQPRLALGTALRGLASAALDVSDGLAGDLRHLAHCSGLQAVVEVTTVPVSEVVQVLSPHPLYWQCVLAGGDDYELCFTAAPQHREALSALSRQLGLPLTRIGHMQAGNGVQWQEGGQPVDWELQGFDHFA